MLPKAGGLSNFPLLGPMKKSRNRSEPGRAGRAAEQKEPAWQNQEAGLSHRRTGHGGAPPAECFPEGTPGPHRPQQDQGVGALAYHLLWLPGASEKMNQLLHPHPSSGPASENISSFIINLLSGPLTGELLPFSIPAAVWDICHVSVHSGIPGCAWVHIFKTHTHTQHIKHEYTT